MARYVKKPIPITAIQWTGDNAKELAEFTNGRCQFRVGRPSIKIPTLEGDMGANIGDYIIRGVDGEFYPCRQDIFLKTYEKIGE
jgi:hypothetical protein